MRKKYGVLTLILLVITSVVLLWMGRLVMCKCGYIKLWHGVVISSENSQHLSDFYTFSHIIHGFFFYWVLWKIARKMPLWQRALIATLIEAFWEIFENSSFVINRYRETTISLDYYGDSVVNSLADIVAMILGFWLAARLPVWIVIVLTIVMEVIVGFIIRDNLALNIIMLLYPFEAIKRWQTGG